MELVKILEASSESLRKGGAPVEFFVTASNGREHTATAITRGARVPTAKLLTNGNGLAAHKSAPARPARKPQIKIVLNGNGNGNGH